MPRDAWPTLDPYALRLIKNRVRRLIGKHGFRAADREDLEQELTVHLLERLRDYQQPILDPAAFCSTVIKRHIIAIIRRQRVKKRYHPRIASLHQAVMDEDGLRVELSQTLPDEQRHERLGVSTQGDMDRIDVTHDVASVLAGLPSELRSLAERLKHQSVAEIARDTGIPRSTLNDTLAKLRGCFEKAGLGNNS